MEKTRKKAHMATRGSRGKASVLEESCCFASKKAPIMRVVKAQVTAEASRRTRLPSRSTRRRANRVPSSCTAPVMMVSWSLERGESAFRKIVAAK